MKSGKKFIVEFEGRAVYASKSYDHARRVAWRIINRKHHCEVIVHLYGIIVGIGKQCPDII